MWLSFSHALELKWWIGSKERALELLNLNCGILNSSIISCMNMNLKASFSFKKTKGLKFGY